MSLEGRGTSTFHSLPPPCLNIHPMLTTHYPKTTTTTNPSWHFPKPPNYNLSIIKGTPGERLWAPSVWVPRSEGPQFFWEKHLWILWKTEVGLTLKSQSEIYSILYISVGKTDRMPGGLGVAWRGWEERKLLTICPERSRWQASWRQDQVVSEEPSQPQ